MTSKTTNKFSPEVRARAVRMVTEHEAEHSSRWAAVSSIAAKIGCSAHTLHEWVKKAEVDSGKRAGLPSDVAEKMKALERENRELRQANEIFTQGLGVFCPGGARPPTEAMISFIEEHRLVLGVEPICRLMLIAPSTYYEVIAKRTDVDRLSARERNDIAMKVEIRRVFNENFQVYGVQGLAAIAARRLRHRPLHRRAAYENNGDSRRHSRQADQNHRVGQVRSMSTRPGEPTVLRSSAEHAVVIRFHLCRDLAGLRLRGLRH